MDKKKLTLNDLIAKKLQKDQKKQQRLEYYVDSLGGEISVEAPSEESTLKAMDFMEEQSISSVNKAYTYLIYHSVPMMRDPKLHEECNVLDPLDIVPALLEFKERMALGEKILEMTGYSEKSNDVKN